MNKGLIEKAAKVVASSRTPAQHLVAEKYLTLVSKRMHTTIAAIVASDEFSCALMKAKTEH